MKKQKTTTHLENIPCAWCGHLMIFIDTGEGFDFGCYEHNCGLAESRVYATFDGAIRAARKKYGQAVSRLKKSR